MGTALTVRSKDTQLSVIDPDKIDYEAGRKWAERESAGKKAFKGEQLGFNGQDGEWKLGFGDKAKVLKEGHEIVVNYPYTMAAWQEWAGKAPNYPHIGYVFAGDALPARHELGMLDQDEWKTNKLKKEKEDPFKEVSVLAARNVKGDALYHILASTVSFRRAVATLIAECIDEAKRKGGKLPVVALSSDRVKGDNGNFYVPVFEIVDWVTRISVDTPEGGMLDDAGGADPEDDDDKGEVKAKSRRSSKPDSEDAEEEENDPRKGNKGRDISKSYEEVEAEDEAPKSRRRPAAEDSEDEDNPPRRRRRDADEDTGETTTRRRRLS